MNEEGLARKREEGYQVKNRALKSSAGRPWMSNSAMLREGGGYLVIFVEGKY